MNERKDAAETAYAKRVNRSCSYADKTTGMVRSTTDAPRAYRAIFFDLDGTLLPMELDEFLSTYFATLADFVGAHGLDIPTFLEDLHAGIDRMIHHDGTRTNAEAFWQEYLARVDTNAIDWKSLLDDFYENEFGTIGRDVCPNPTVARVLQVLVEKGYPLVLATMPLFPRRAVEWRLAWAGVNPALFDRITTYENSTSVKPKPAYCAENLAACNLRGSDVLMVGNNTVEDGVFASLGTDVYLITDHLLDPAGKGVEGLPHGTMDDFLAWVNALPVCENPAETIENGVIEATARETARTQNLQVGEDAIARAVHASSTFNSEVAGSLDDAPIKGV